MHLSELLGTQLIDENSLENFIVYNLTDDSRLVKRGGVFVWDKRVFAPDEHQGEGEKFIESAKQAGARLVISNVKSDGCVYLENPAEVLIKWAKSKHPNQPENLVAVTGTNGKTSTAWFYQYLMSKCSKTSASIGTLGVADNSGSVEYTGYTSPTALKLHEILNNLHNQKITHCCMEVSSHALEQQRVDGCNFTAAAFTNLSQDHCDYHGSMEAYFNAKKRLFTELLNGGTAIINIKNKEGAELAEICKNKGIKVITFADNNSDVCVKVKELLPDGMLLDVSYQNFSATVKVPLVGNFQAENLAAALGLGVAGDESFEHMVESLKTITSVPGRMEVIKKTKTEIPTVIVDYAHTPDALEKALQALRPQVEGKLWVVVGCGGNRDATKRPQMGKIASDLADMAIITDDNPRFEDAASIREQMMTTVENGFNIGNRKKAIYKAVQEAAKNDIILLAGKGHETGQLINGEVFPFDDRKIAAQALKSLG